MKLTTLMGLEKKPVWEEPGEGGGAPPSDPPPTPEAPDLSFIPDDFKTDDGFDGPAFRTKFDEMVASQAQHDERAGQVPDEASGYEFTTPEEIDFGDLDLPEGFEVKLLEDEAFKPLFDGFGEFLHKHNIPAEASKDAMTLLSKYEATKFSQSFAAGKAEIDGLDKGKERVNELGRKLENLLPEAQSTALKASLRTAEGVRALEKLLTPKSFGTPPPDPSDGKDIDPLKARYPRSA